MQCYFRNWLSVRSLRRWSGEDVCATCVSLTCCVLPRFLCTTAFTTCIGCLSILVSEELGLSLRWRRAYWNKEQCEPFMKRVNSFQIRGVQIKICIVRATGAYWSSHEKPPNNSIRQKQKCSWVARSRTLNAPFPCNTNDLRPPSWKYNRSSRAVRKNRIFTYKFQELTSIHSIRVGRRRQNSLQLRESIFQFVSSLTFGIWKLVWFEGGKTIVRIPFYHYFQSARTFGLDNRNDLLDRLKRSPSLSLARTRGAWTHRRCNSRPRSPFSQWSAIALRIPFILAHSNMKIFTFTWQWWRSRGWSATRLDKRIRWRNRQHVIRPPLDTAQKATVHVQMGGFDFVEVEKCEEVRRKDLVVHLNVALVIMLESNRTAQREALPLLWTWEN